MGFAALAESPKYFLLSPQHGALGVWVRGYLLYLTGAVLSFWRGRTVRYSFLLLLFPRDFFPCGEVPHDFGSVCLSDSVAERPNNVILLRQRLVRRILPSWSSRH